MDASTALRYWLPAVAWAVAILSLSGEAGSSGTTERLITPVFGDVSPDRAFYINYSVRKAAHVVGYGILGGLNYRAIRAGREGWSLGWSIVAVVLAIFVAAIDELHQSTSSTRTGALADIGFDGCGAALAQVVMRRASR